MLTTLHKPSSENCRVYYYVAYIHSLVCALGARLDIMFFFWWHSVGYYVLFLVALGCKTRNYTVALCLYVHIGSITITSH